MLATELFKLLPQRLPVDTVEGLFHADLGIQSCPQVVEHSYAGKFEQRTVLGQNAGSFVKMPTEFDQKLRRAGFAPREIIPVRKQ